MLRRPYFLCSWHRADAILIGIIAEVLRNELQIKDSELQIFNCDLEMVSGQDSWSGPSPNLYGWCLLWTGVPAGLECWICDKGFGCWIMLRFLEQVTC